MNDDTTEIEDITGWGRKVLASASDGSKNGRELRATILEIPALLIAVAEAISDMHGEESIDENEPNRRLVGRLW